MAQQGANTFFAFWANPRLSPAGFPARFGGRGAREQRLGLRNNKHEEIGSLGMQRRLLMGLGLASACHARAGEPALVRMPGLPFLVSEQRHFQRDLLLLALRKADWPAQVQILPPQTWLRQVRELRDGYADVSPLPALQTDVYATYRLLRVDFALRGGLLGVRRLLTLAHRTEALSKLRSLRELQRDFTLGYGADWGDLAVMRRLGFRIKTASSTEELYAMLRKGEVDYLSRGLNEVAQELAAFGDATPRVAVVPRLLLHYPLDDCFFVAPQRPQLRDALALGLSRARADGSFAELLGRHYGEELVQVAGARTLRVPGYPQPPALPATEFDAWRSALNTQVKPIVSAPRRLVMAAGQSPEDPRFRYATALLQLALEKVGHTAELLPRGGLTQPRQAIELYRGGLDVGQLPSSGTVQPGQALAVPIPIRRGLLGVRLLLARRERASVIAQAPTLEALQQGFVMGHGADWGDLGLMRQSGFRVQTSDSYPGLFRMLEAGRFDFLSRAVSEIWDELANPRLAGGGALVVVPRLALFYPLDDFFWVSPARPELAALIQQGLERARADGSFERLYRTHYGEALLRAQLRQRQVFRLPGVEPPPGSSERYFDALEQFFAHSSGLTPSLRVG